MIATVIMISISVNPAVRVFDGGRHGIGGISFPDGAIVRGPRGPPQTVAD
jgi:hypothetical protein